MFKIFNNFLNWFDDRILPNRCAVCRRSGPTLCPACRARIPRLKIACPLCGKLSTLGLICDQCRTDTFKFDGVISFGPYETSGLKPALQALKYQGVKDIGPKLGKMLGRILQAEWSKYSRSTNTSLTPLIIPIPLHPRRERDRSYNQALLIAQGVEKISGWPLAAKSLTRHSYQAPSAGLTYDSRRIQKKIYSYHGENLTGRCIFLIDDIITTGATANIAALTLKEAGASLIIAATAAQTE